MSNATAFIAATGICPTHGPQQFVRVSECNWWECPLADSFVPGSCGSVIPDELLTPDGAEVAHISRSRWHGDMRTWLPA